MICYDIPELESYEAKHFTLYNSIQLFIMLIGKTSILWIIYELHLPVPFPQDSDQLPSTSTHDQPAVDSIDDLQILKNFDLTLEYGPCTGKLQYYKLWIYANLWFNYHFIFIFFISNVLFSTSHTHKKKMTKRKKKRSKISFTVSINFYCRNYTIRTMGKSSKTWFKSPWWSQGHSSKTQRWRIPDVVRFVETQSYLSKKWEL